jgi:hypothetical protein
LKTKNTNNTGALILTKVDGHGLIGAIGYHHILTMPHWPTNERVTSDNFIF